MAAKAAEEAQAALSALSLRPPSQPNLAEPSGEGLEDTTYVTEPNTTTTIPKPASKLPPPGILKNANGATKLPAGKAKLSAKDKKVRDMKIDRVIQLLPLEFRGNDPDLRRVMEGVIGSLMDHEPGRRIAEIVKPPLMPQGKVNKCLIALVNRKVVEKEANKGAAIYHFCGIPDR